MKALLFCAVVSGVAWGQESPGDFPYRAPIATPGSASHYRFVLPAATYQGAARRDLADLRVFNAAGETVPHAFVPRAAQKPEPRLEAARLFPLYGDPAKSIDTTSVRVERNARGTVVSVSVQNGVAARRRALIGYLLDASEIKQPLEALLLDWEPTEPFTGHARVEASDDLRAWSTLVAGSPLLYLQHAGARLERRRIELGGARGRYLRLSFTGVPSAFALRQARLELRAEKPELEREWRSLEGVEGKLRGEWTYDSGGHFPADRVRLHLPQPNTVVQVQLLTRERADDGWRMAGAAVAYRLSGPSGEIVSPDIPVRTNAERYWLVKVDPKGGGVGAGELRLEIGWVPHEVVFAARGAGPFALAYGNPRAGNAKANGGPLPLSAVLPRRGDGADAAVAVRATVGAVAMNVPAPPSLFREPLRFARTLIDDRDVKKWTLWTVLVAGVALLAWMAFRLLHETGGGAEKR
jgi:hypothetical protein